MDATLNTIQRIIRPTEQIDWESRGFKVNF